MGATTKKATGSWATAARMGRDEVTAIRVRLEATNLPPRAALAWVYRTAADVIMATPICETWVVFVSDEDVMIELANGGDAEAARALLAVRQVLGAGRPDPKHAGTTIFAVRA